MKGYLTLDYELFMGESGTPNNCLIRPMGELQKTSDKLGVKATIFVDAAYLFKLHELKDNQDKLSTDFLDVVNNIKELQAEGHSIQLHLHPQWLYSYFDGVDWQMDKYHYKLSDLSLEEQQEVFSKCQSLLSEITSKNVYAFRAGGYSIPDEFGYIKDIGVYIDSSVQPGMYCKSKYQNYDFRTCPQKSCWRFSKHPNKEDQSGCFTEYPISIAKEGILHYALRRLKYRFGHDVLSKASWGDGTSINEDTSATGHVNKVKRLLQHRSVLASIDKYDADLLEYVYRKQKNGECFVIIGHPKNITPYSIGKYEEFVRNHPEIQWDIM